MKHLEIEINGYTYRIKRRERHGRVSFGVWEYAESLRTWHYVYGLYAPIRSNGRSAYITIATGTKHEIVKRHNRVIKLLRRRFPWKTLQLIFSV